MWHLLEPVLHMENTGENSEDKLLMSVLFDQLNHSLN
jgi:hypothetical protein